MISKKLMFSNFKYFVFFEHAILMDMEEVFRTGRALQGCQLSSSQTNLFVKKVSFSCFQPGCLLSVLLVFWAPLFMPCRLAGPRKKLRLHLAGEVGNTCFHRVADINFGMLMKTLALWWFYGSLSWMII